VLIDNPPSEWAIYAGTEQMTRQMDEVLPGTIYYGRNIGSTKERATTSSGWLGLCKASAR